MTSKDAQHNLKWIFPSLLLIVNLLCYWQTTNFDFVWDDQPTHLAGNQELMEENWSRFWEEPYEGLYIPVSYTVWTFIKDSAEQGQQARSLSPFPFHLANVLTHLLNVLLVYLLFSILFNDQTSGLIAGLVVSIHPLQVESVAWISEFRGLLAAFFSLVSLTGYVYLRNSQNQLTTDSKILLNCGIIIVWSLGVLSKPIAIVAPLFLVILEVFHFYSRKWKEYVVPAIMILLSLPIQVITKNAQPEEEVTFSAPLWSRPFIAADSINFTLWKLLAPFHLSTTYGRKPEWLLDQWWMWLTILLPLAFTGLLWYYRHWYKHLFTGFLLFIAGLLPVSGIMAFYFQKFSTVADRYAYFPMIGIGMMLAGFYCQAKYKQLLLGIYAAIAILWLLLTLQRVEVWQNSITLWEDAVEKYSGQPRAHSNLGIAYHNKGNFRQAVNQYNQAIEADSMFVKAYTNRGNSYAFMRRYQKAIKSYNLSIRIDSTYANAYYNRAVALFQTKRYEQAWQDLTRAQKLGYPVNPRFQQILKKKLAP